jgi:DNA-3-methyladenine glycosylase II
MAVRCGTAQRVYGANDVPVKAGGPNMTTPTIYGQARRHLGRRDPVLKALMSIVGPCRLRPDAGDPFALLVRSIISQMISTKAAAAILAKVQTAVGGPGLTPAGVLALSEAELRAAGLSGAKVRCLQTLAARALGGELPLARLQELADEEIAAHLLPLPGIGTWTVEMFLIFGLGRLDVLPVGDLGVRAGVRDVYGLADLPTPDELRERAEAWRPYRTVASWYMWRSRGAVPQSKPR